MSEEEGRLYRVWDWLLGRPGWVWIVSLVAIILAMGWFAESRGWLESFLPITANAIAVVAVVYTALSVRESKHQTSLIQAQLEQAEGLQLHQKRTLELGDRLYSLARLMRLLSPEPDPDDLTQFEVLRDEILQFAHDYPIGMPEVGYSHILHPLSDDWQERRWYMIATGQRTPERSESGVHFPTMQIRSFHTRFATDMPMLPRTERIIRDAIQAAEQASKFMDLLSLEDEKLLEDAVGALQYFVTILWTRVERFNLAIPGAGERLLAVFNKPGLPNSALLLRFLMDEMCGIEELNEVHSAQIEPVVARIHAARRGLLDTALNR